MKFVRFLAFASVLLVFVGCAKKQTTAARARVTGQVTLDKIPLKTGQIAFDLATGEPPAVFDILDGSFEGKAPVGKNKVTINSVTKVSMKEKMGMDGPGYDQPVEMNILPPRYNSKSEITREVEASGDNKFNFDLQSR